MNINFKYQNSLQYEKDQIKLLKFSLANNRVGFLLKGLIYFLTVLLSRVFLVSAYNLISSKYDEKE